MQRALLRGASTAEAARYALEQLPPGVASEAGEATSGVLNRVDPADTGGTHTWQPHGAQGVQHLPRTSVRIETQDGAVVLAAQQPINGKECTDQIGSGHSELARRLSRSVLAMDVSGVQQLLAKAVAEQGAVGAWQEVIRPVLVAVGAGWRGARAGAEVEFLLAECAFGALIRATPVLEEPRNHRPVLLGTAPAEPDSLTLYALAAGLAEHGIATQLFGFALPINVLSVAVRRSAPAAVVLWARRKDVADQRAFTEIARGRTRSRLFACGPGWQSSELPSKVELLDDLPEAVTRLEHVLVGRASKDQQR